MKTQLVAQMRAYLDGEMGLAALVHWAEGLVVDGFEASPVETEIIFRLGVADAENFELSWEELSDMLRQLGFKARLQLQAV